MKKQEANLASTTSPDDRDWPGRRIDIQIFKKTLIERRAELGNPELPRNDGKSRTPSKIALLKAIEDAGGKW